MLVRDGKGAGGILISAEREVEGAAQPDAVALPLPADVQSLDDIQRMLRKLACSHSMRASGGSLGMLHPGQQSAAAL